MFSDAMKRRFGKKLYKLALDGGMTCPTRDGTKGTRGCIFCSESGGGDFAARRCGSIDEQIDIAVKTVGTKADGALFAAYYQSYTNTYAPIDYLEGLFYATVTNLKISVMSVGTRPDCLPDDVIELLKQLNRIKPVWVELGLQTVHQSTADYIRRGYTLDVYDDAVSRLHKAGIEVITHLILGLPGEDKNMMMSSARYAGACSDGIKLQLLHVLKDSDLYADYLSGRVEPLGMEQYFDILAGCLSVIPRDVVIHRLTGDGAKKNLVAPTWSADKKRVLNSMNAFFKECDVIQGSAPAGE